MTERDAEQRGQRVEAPGPARPAAEPATQGPTVMSAATTANQRVMRAACVANSLVLPDDWRSAAGRSLSA